MNVAALAAKPMGSPSPVRIVASANVELGAPVSVAPLDATPAKPAKTPRQPLGKRLLPVFKVVAPPMLGIALLIGVWAMVAMKGSIPGPAQTWNAAVVLFSDPFYSNGPNDQGIGWNVLSSLKRVGIGFGFAALVGIPLGFIIGRFAFMNSMVSPIISLLRPVSPLAWLPIGLLVFKQADPAATWTIFICSIWPMIINTAVGVQRVPQDYMNVARVLQLGRLEITRRILIPGALPHIITGMRLSLGVAWMVIVAAEMLTGGIGIGFFVWDEWNNLNVASIIVAIGVIGVVGIALEAVMNLVQNRLDYTRR